MLAKFAHISLHELKITPRQFYEMDSWEQSFVIASILVRGEEKEQEAKEIKAKSRSKG